MLSDSIDHSYPVSAIVLTQEDIILVTDISWMAVKANEKVLAKHIKPFAMLRQIVSYFVPNYPVSGFVDDLLSLTI